ncbi:MAG: hypothetical protein IMZ64_11970, partial [Bacteroidetes bacterium]|nr:hypothetical protein [Bacteroidota bacterium]
MLIVGIAGGTGSGKTKINFDHPDSVEFGLLIDHREQLKKGNPIEIEVLISIIEK